MNRSEVLNGGAYATFGRVLGNQAATAGGSGDNTEVNGAWLDRNDAIAGLMMSAKLGISFTTTLGIGQTLAFDVQVQHASDIAGSDAADYGPAVTGILAANGASGGATVAEVAELDVGLEGAKRFVRFQITPQLSAANTDTANWSAVVAWFGGRKQPITRSPVAHQVP